jgi:hypothetical protein
MVPGGNLTTNIGRNTLFGVVARVAHAQSAGVTVTTRPSSRAWDAGAYEYTNPPTNLTATVH